MVTITYLVITGTNVFTAKADYETMLEAEDIAHSMKCGVFDNEDAEYQLVNIKQD
jgi:hypothetical protein